MHSKQTGGIFIKLIVLIAVIVVVIMIVVPYYLATKVTNTISERSLYTGAIDACIGKICHSSSEELKKDQEADSGKMWSKQVLISPVPAVIASYIGENSNYTGCRIIIKFENLSWKCAIENCSAINSNSESSGMVISKWTNGYCN